MNILSIITLYPLADSSFWPEKNVSSSDIVFLVSFIAVVVIGLIIYNVNKRGPSGGKTSSSGTSTGTGGGVSSLFSGFTLHRVARNIGLDHDQKKMLDFVFRTDDVTDPEKSINTPSLLDRHFKRAFRVIEKSANTDEEAQHRLSVLFSTRNLLESRVGGSLTSTRQFKDDAQVIITYNKEKFNVTIESTKGEHLAVDCPKNALGSPIKIPRGSRIIGLSFTNEHKGYMFESRVVGYSNSHGSSVVLLAHSNQLKFLSQRRFRRKQAVIPCNIHLVYSEGSGKKQRMVVDKRYFSGSIADISVGGCSIKTKTPVQVGTKMKIEFNNDDHNVAALGQVLRTNRAGSVTIIHIKFLRVSRKSMNIINAFVYEYAHE